MKTVKDIKIGDMFSMERNGEKLSCTIIECRRSLFPDVLNFIARLEGDNGVISLCGLPDNDYLHFGCNLKEANRPKNEHAFIAEN